MLRIRLTLSFLMTMIFLSSCGLAKPVPQPLPSPSRRWTIKLNQSGGFAGVQLNVEISSDGQLTAQDQRTNRSVTQTLPSQTMTKLNQFISNLSIPSTGVPQSACADCYIYDMNIQTEESDLHILVDDVTIKNTSAADLIMFVIKLRDGALSSNP